MQPGRVGGLWRGYGAPCGGNEMHGRLKTAAGYLLGTILIAAWLWGVARYAMAGNVAGAIGAFVVPPVGVLHAAGLF
jgi:hypothetical protein